MRQDARTPDRTTGELRAGARVVFADNSGVQCREWPIVETDARGNTYQRRELRDGSLHRVLKNFPGEAELRRLLAPCAATIAFRELDNFWLLEYELAGGARGHDLGGRP